VDSRGGLVSQAYLHATLFFGALRGAGFEHELEGTHLLMGGGDRAASFVGFGSGGFPTFLLCSDLCLAPLEQAFEVAKECHRQRGSGQRSLGLLHLVNDHAHSGFRRVQQACLMSDHQFSLCEHLALRVQPALALLEGDLECCVRPLLHPLPARSQ
jgi:hypothetical protein